jgi:TonB family protein
MRERTTRIHFIISIVFHLLLVLAWTVSEWVFAPGRGGVPEDLSEDRFVFEVIETPDDLPDENPDRETNLVSDKSTRAADENPLAREGPDIPYSPGEFIFKRFEQPVGGPTEPDGREAVEETPGDPAEVGLSGDGETSGDYSIPATSGDFKNLASSLARKGGVSFNTYEWDFAPYMLAMKRRVERNMHPPYAFTHMGMVSGTNILSFTVLRDGTVKGLRILGSETHFSLDRTSLRAVELSAPFLPLPDDFPEDVLEVTARFSYIIH